MTSMPSVLNAAMAYAAFPYSTSFRLCAADRAWILSEVRPPTQLCPRR